MFATKGRLKVALLVIGVLVVVFGWYADAHYRWWNPTCWISPHRNTPPYTVYEDVYLGDVGEIITCYECGSWAVSIMEEYQTYRVRYQDTEHTVAGDWITCHIHELSRTPSITGLRNQRIECSNTSCVNAPN